MSRVINVGKSSAYGIALKHGFVGTEDEWIASLKGDKGDPGEKGDQGEKGDTGEKGDAGEVPAASLAEEFDATKAYSAGDYVWHSGTLYRFTADHAAGAWTGTDATACQLANDTADLKKALDESFSVQKNTVDIITALGKETFLWSTSDFVQGYRHGKTHVVTDPNYVVTKSPVVFIEGSTITCPSGTKFYIVLSDGTIYGSIGSASATVDLIYTFTENVFAYVEINRGSITSFTLNVTIPSSIKQTLNNVAENRLIIDNEFKRKIIIPGSFKSAYGLCDFIECENIAKVFITNKNMLPFNVGTVTNHGITFTKHEDGSITLSGTSDGVAVLEFTSTNMPPLKNGKFTMSIKNAATIGDSLTYLQLSINGAYSPTHICRFDVQNSSYTFELSDADIVTGYRYRISSGYSMPEDFTIYPQIEEGTKESEYVTNQVKQFTPTEAQSDNVECFTGYNYVCAKGTMTGEVTYLFSLVDAMKELEGNSFSQLSGKTIVCFGDSITGNYMPPLDYPSLLAEMTGATVYNVGFGGCCMSDNGQQRKDFTMCRLADAIVANDYTPQINSGVSITYGGTSINYVPTRIATLQSIDWTSVDYITIAYGTNDWNSNYGLDNPENPLDTTTYIGAFRYSIEKLLTAYPNLKVLPITPLWRWWDTNSGMPSGETGDYLDANTYAKGTGYYLWNYGDALVEAAKAYHIPTLDMYHNCMMNKYNRFQYFNPTDGTHPKLEGRILFAEILEAALTSKY